MKYVLWYYTGSIYPLDEGAQDKYFLHVNDTFQWTDYQLVLVKFSLQMLYYLDLAHHDCYGTITYQIKAWHGTSISTILLQHDHLWYNDL
jgi:hypothetical protein